MLLYLLVAIALGVGELPQARPESSGVLQPRLKPHVCPEARGEERDPLQARHRGRDDGLLLQQRKLRLKTEQAVCWVSWSMVHCSTNTWVSRGYRTVIMACSPDFYAYPLRGNCAYGSTLEAHVRTRQEQHLALLLPIRLCNRTKLQDAGQTKMTAATQFTLTCSIPC